MNEHPSLPLSVYPFMLSAVRSFSEWLMSVYAVAGLEPGARLGPALEMSSVWERRWTGPGLEPEEGLQARVGTVKGCSGGGNTSGS